jgi:hypothetical protein
MDGGQPQVVDKDGERGRNRTYNLLIVKQSAKCLLFQRLLDFHSRQKWAVLGVFVMKDGTSFEPQTSAIVGH